MGEILWELANKNVDLIWLVVDHPSEKSWSESQLALLFPIYGKIKNDPNHQPVYHYRLPTVTIVGESPGPHHRDACHNAHEDLHHLRGISAANMSENRGLSIEQM